MPERWQQAQARFYTGHPTHEALLQAASVVCKEGVHVSGAIYTASIPAPKLVKRLTGDTYHRWRISSVGPSLYLVELPDLLQANESGKFFLWAETRDNLILLLSCQPREAFDAMRSRLYWHLVPDLCRVFLRTREVYAGLNDLVSSASGVSVRVLEYVSRSLIDDSKSHKRVRTNRQWTDEDYSIVFAKLLEERQWFSSAKIRTEGSIRSSGRIWRDASFACEEEVPFFLDTVLKAFQRAVVKSQRFFEKRDRSTSPSGLSRPLTILYREDVFSDKAQNQRLIKTLHHLSNSALSVLHPNPYLHATLVDYADGSSYDIWVATPSSILIVPKQKASTTSLERVCNHICNEFEEGDIEEFSLS